MVRSKKQEWLTDDRQNPEDGNPAKQAFLLASYFLLLASNHSAAPDFPLE
jgi:hypothetical protein